MIFVMRGPLRRLVGFKAQLSVEGDTVSEGLRVLCEEYPNLRRALLDGSGRLRGVHRLAVNRAMVGRNELHTPVGGGDVIDVVTSLAGG